MKTSIWIAGSVTIDEEERKMRKRRKIWSQPWFRLRHQYGHKRLMDEYRQCPRTFREYLKMSESTYLLLLSLVKQDIEKENTIMRPAITAHDRFSAKLGFLATGEKLSDLQARCNISRASLCSILPTTCRAIVKALRDQIKLPRSAEGWRKIAEKFHRQVSFSRLKSKKITIIYLNNRRAFFHVWVLLTASISGSKNLPSPKQCFGIIKDFFRPIYWQSSMPTINLFIVTSAPMDQGQMQSLCGIVCFTNKF